MSESLATKVLSPIPSSEYARSVSDIGSTGASLLDDTLPTMTTESVRLANAKTGVIYTSFADRTDVPEFEGLTDFPRSYYTTSPKERLLLLFAENFRRQYIQLYPARKPPILAVNNECGIQVSNL